MRRKPLPHALANLRAAGCFRSVDHERDAEPRLEPTDPDARGEHGFGGCAAAHHDRSTFDIEFDADRRFVHSQRDAACAADSEPAARGVSTDRCTRVARISRPKYGPTA